MDEQAAGAEVGGGAGAQLRRRGGRPALGQELGLQAPGVRAGMAELMPAMGSLATGQFNPAAHVGKAGHDPATLETLLALGDQLTRGPKWHDALGSFSGPER